MEGQTEMRPDKIYIQMLGNFSMVYQGKQIQLGKWLSAKMIHLLLLLICSREEGVSRKELIRRLYDADETDNQASNSLRAMIFRLRRSIQESGLPEGEYISTKGGRYTWTNQPLETELDVETFQKLVKAAFEEVDPKLRADLLKTACRFYGGDFMPDMVSDEWVGKTSWRYRELYMRSLRELSRQLKKQKRYEELLKECERVVANYPLEEWQRMKMECLISMKRYREAAAYYEALEQEARQTCSPFMSGELKEKYLKAKHMIQYESADLDQIQADLACEPEQEGAAFCEYLEFTDIYRYLQRVFAREGITSQLLLLTLTDESGTDPESSPELERARSAAEYAIRKTFTRSDLCTRYGNNQYLVLLSSPELRDGKKAQNGIQKYYEEASRNARIMLKCEHNAVKLEDK